MPSIKHAIITAAGLGSRLGMDSPKALVTVGSKTIIEYQLELLANIPDVRVVVGFQERRVMDFVSNIRPDVTFVRNQDYTHSNVAYSLYLGSRFLSEPFITIDGDVLVHPDSFQEFTNMCTMRSQSKPLVCIAPSRTEDAVFVTLDEAEKNISGFQRKPVQDYEFPGLIYFPENIFTDAKEPFVYQVLENHLPLNYHKIISWEVDTPQDLELAKDGWGRIQSP